MKVAADFRSIARKALSGRWVIAVIAGLIASLLGAVSSSGPEFEFNFEGGSADAALNLGGREIFSFSQLEQSGILSFLMGAMVYLILAALVMAVIFFLLGSVVSLGYSRFNLDLVDRQKEPQINTLFDYFKHWKTAAVAKLLQFVYIFAWALLFIIPGIVAAYSYAMTDFILAEHPEMTASEAIEQSKQMMQGNRFRLFCLDFSFIGWAFLASLTWGIGYLWLNPYQYAARAAFYRDVSGTEYIIPAPENME